MSRGVRGVQGCVTERGVRVCKGRPASLADRQTRQTGRQQEGKERTVSVLPKCSTTYYYYYYYYHSYSYSYRLGVAEVLHSEVEVAYLHHRGGHQHEEEHVEHRRTERSRVRVRVRVRVRSPRGLSKVRLKRVSSRPVV